MPSRKGGTRKPKERLPVCIEDFGYGLFIVEENFFDMGVHNRPALGNIAESTRNVTRQLIRGKIHEHALPKLVIFSSTQPNFIVDDGKGMGGKSVNVCRARGIKRRVRDRFVVV